MNILKQVFGLIMLAFLTGGWQADLFAQKKGTIQYLRPYDLTGANTFEMPMQTDIKFEGFSLEWGAAFRQQWQTLTHENRADPNINPDTGEDLNALPKLGPGFNTANANLFLDAQLAEGVRVHVSTYLSSRHHREAWVKGGYLQFDALPMLNSPVADALLENFRIKVGHYEVNYGDQHYRRSDNAQALYNPFVGNYIMDPFTTEIGGEIQYMNSGFLAVLAVTGGEIKGDVTNEDTRAPSFIGKLGYDNRATEGLRFRLTGSIYGTRRSNFNTLYFGDRAGSHYFGVMEGGDFSGRFNPGLHNELTSFIINPFLQYKGLELFGTYEQANGTGFDEAIQGERTWEQYGLEAVYRFMPKEQVYVGVRYNNISGDLAFSGVDATVDRWQIAAGWYMTEKVMLKFEYVTQDYDDFPSSSILHQGKFDGLVLEGIVAF